MSKHSEDKWKFITGKPFYPRTGTKPDTTTEPGNEYSPTSDIEAAITNLPESIGTDVRAILIGKMNDIDELHSASDRKKAEQILLEYIKELPGRIMKKGGLSKKRKSNRNKKNKSKKTKTKKTKTKRRKE